MEEDWFKTKFINPRTREGKPQTERLEYARELFESFGMQDERFSGAVMVGSTIRGSGYEEISDIDVVLFYYEESKKEQKPKHENSPGIIELNDYEKVYSTFKHDFQNFEYDLRFKKERESKKYFRIDIRPGIYNLAKFEFSPQNILRIQVLWKH